MKNGWKQSAEDRVGFRGSKVVGALVVLITISFSPQLRRLQS